MSRVDLVIANPGHHTAMTAPVVRYLRRRGIDCRILSLCGFRGRRSPRQEFEALGVGFETPLEAAAARAGRGAVRRLGSAGVMRRLARHLAWQRLLGPWFEARLDSPALVVVPNDAAFPYDRILDAVARRRWPSVLLQEGIRFPLPGETSGRRYGCGGASALAVWGDASARHFRELGVDPARLHVTGSPRFDEPLGGAGSAPLGVDSLEPGHYLALVTNPVDQQGYCSKRQKLELVATVARWLSPALARRGLRLVVKTHSGEAAADYRSALAGHTVAGSPTVLGEVPLHSLLAGSAGVLVLASTVGLEALLLGRPLGVLALPRYGFVHDYVARGAALGLTPDADPEATLERLLAGSEQRRDAVQTYMEEHLAHRGEATARVGQLIERLLESSGKP